MSETSAFLQLLRKMGHDMRVPLNTLISTSDMLVAGIYDPLTPKQSKAAVRLQRNSHRLLAMLDDFVTYMKADAGELLFNVQPFDPCVQLQTWCDQVRPTAEEKGLTLHLTTAEDVPATLTGDETAVSRIVLALLWNAVSFTLKGEIRVTSGWTANQEWLITIEDSGPGITADELPHIYEPFWRGAERPIVPTAGAGLGLPLAAALAKAMQGQFDLKQTSPQGSTFCVQLPLASGG